MALKSVLVLAAAGSARAQETQHPVHFLVMPRPSFPYPTLRSQSCVVPLSRPEHIEHARQLIALDAVNRHGSSDPLPPNSGTIVVAQVAAGSDGVNRNYSVPGFPAWSWHLAGRLGFGDYIAWEIAAVPTDIEAFIDYYVEEGARFIHSTIGRELGPVPAATWPRGISSPPR